MFAGRAHPVQPSPFHPGTNARRMFAVLALVVVAWATLSGRVALGLEPAAAQGCNISIEHSGSCIGYSFCTLVDNAPSFVLNDSYPEPYLVAPPFAVAIGPGGTCAVCPGGTCAACSASQAGANGYQFRSGSPVCAARCIALAFPSRFEAAQLLESGHPTDGVAITFGGGADGRQLIHKVKCRADTPLRPIGLIIDEHGKGVYIVHWEGAAGCGHAVSSCASPTPPPSLPRPTAAQLRWQELEIGALIHFNMATYAPGGTRPGAQCSPDPDTFDPVQLDTDQWVQAFEAFGCREAVLVVKHNCGFVTWPTNATHADGSRYNYSVAYSKWRNGEGDVVRDFASSCLKRGLGVGYYYSLGHRPGNPAVRPTGAEELQMLNELWSNYGNNGNLTEIWFDGGFEGHNEPNIRAMLNQLQPDAQAFNGCRVRGGSAPSKASCITPNALRWIGTEMGAAPDPTWSTGFEKGGDPSSDMWCPAESDTTLQLEDQWFYDDKIGIRSLGELQDVYHSTVGHNSFLMMDFAIAPSGLVAQDQLARYREFGDWMRDCYEGHGRLGGIDYPLFSTTDQTSGSSGETTGTDTRESLELRWGAPRLIDRVVLREDQTNGQAVRGWSVEAQLAGDSEGVEWQEVANGTSIGNKWITLFPINISVVALRAVVTASAAPPKLRTMSAHMCPRANIANTCTTQQNFAANGVGRRARFQGISIGGCCTACEKELGCALFVHMPPTQLQQQMCTLFNASSVGGKTVAGAVSGSPPVMEIS